MARIYKLGRIWCLDVSAGGRRIRKRVGTSKKVAELALKDAEVKVARKEFGFADKDMVLEKFLDQYLDYSRANHQPSTTNRYRAVTDHFRQFIGDRRQDVAFVSQVNTEVIDQYKVWRKNALVNPNGQPVDQPSEYTRKGARAHTINFEIGALKTIFNQGIKWGYVKENPTGKVKKLKVNDARPVRFLTHEECQQLLNACPEDMYPIYATFLYTGMRKAELENLEWDDVDFERGKIRIRRKESWQPKTGEREIPMSDLVARLLSDLYDRRLDRSTYVFADPKTGGKIRAKLREKLIRIAQQAGIPDLTKVHTLRHTFASHLVMKGVDLPTVQKLMGHSDIQTTMIYAHLAPDHLAEAVNRISFE
jgi:integrase